MDSYTASLLTNERRQTKLTIELDLILYPWQSLINVGIGLEICVLLKKTILNLMDNVKKCSTTLSYAEMSYTINFKKFMCYIFLTCLISIWGWFEF